ncbi:MAG: tRNA lysidine(34) synthetase TilS [Acidimicrobiia bacterium]|nr:tRNA lysidine(34) synthetase TilS [Acidimicrobiia bacterium]
MDPTGGMIPGRFDGVEGGLVIALSGGPDSAAVAVLAQEAGMALRAIHVDHGLPGSPGMRAAATAIASALGIDLEVVEVRPAAASETSLREARYGALLSHVDAGETVVTGHTSDDQAETVLMNLLRGAGPRGLAGIPARRGRILRPYLDHSAAELRTVAVDRGLPFVDDPENRSTDHLRNRVRAELIPLLERRYHSEVRATLARTARNMTDLADVLESVASRVPLERSPLGIRAPLGRLAAVDHLVRRQVYRRMLAAVRPPRPPSEAEVHRVEATFLGGGTSEFAATEARCCVDGPWLIIGVAPRADERTVELDDGIAWGDFTFRLDASGSRPLRISRWRFATTIRPLWVRGARRDDVIAMRDGSKSVIESIRERGHSPANHPVVADVDGRIVWIPGVRHAWTSFPEQGPPESGYLVIVVDQDSPWAPFEP